MSDVFEGPGWWMASDGKWYAPERHPDPAYRERFLTPEPIVEPAPAEEASGFPSVTAQENLEAQEPSYATYADLSRAIDPDAQGEDAHVPGEHARAETPVVDSPEIGAAETVEPGEMATAAYQTPTIDAVEAQASVIPEEIAEVEPSAQAPPIEEPQQVPEVRVGRTVISEQPERPVFDMAPPASVRTSNGGPRQHDVELEVGRDKHAVRQIASEVMSKPLGTTTTAIVPVERTEYDEVTVRDKVIASVIFLSGVAMIVGSFLNWTGGQLEQTGWDRGDGIITVLAGVVGSAAAGPIYVGFRHMVPKLTAMICGALGFAVAALAWITTASDTGPGSATVGVGLIIAGIASLAMALAGLADRGEELY